MNIWGYPDGVFTSSGGGTGGGGDQTAATYTATDQFYGRDGTDSKPAYSFTTEHSTGMQKSASGELSFNTLGAKRLKLNGSRTESIVTVLAPSYTASTGAFLAGDGSASRPSFGFTTSQSTGLYSSAPDEASISVGGFTSYRSRGTYTNIFNQLRCAGGIQNAPGISFEESNNNFGFFYNDFGSQATNPSLSVSVAASQAALFTATYTESKNPYHAPVGASSGPSYSYPGHTSSGVYFNTSSSSVSTAVGGTEALIVSSSATESKNPYLAQIGPTIAYGFAGASASGMSWDSGALKLAGGTTGLLGISDSEALSSVDVHAPHFLAPLTAPIPVYSFEGATDAGMSSEGTGLILSTPGSTDFISFQPDQFYWTQTAAVPMGLFSISQAVLGNFNFFAATCLGRFSRSSTVGTTQGYSTDAAPVDMGTLTTLITDPCGVMVPVFNASLSANCISVPGGAGSLAFPIYRVSGVINWGVANTSPGTYTMYLSPYDTLDSGATIRIGNLPNNQTQEVEFHGLMTIPNSVHPSNLTLWVTSPVLNLNTVNVLSIDVSVERVSV